MKSRPEPKTIALIALTLTLWGSAFAGIKIGLTGYGPGELALLRFLVASAVLGVYAVAVRMKLPARRDLPVLFLAGLLGVTIYHVALNAGERTVSAGAASLIVAAGPVFTALMSRAFLGERITRLGWVGVAVSFLGVALISFGEGGDFGLEVGALLVLVSALSTAGYMIVSKRLLGRYGSLEFTSYMIWTGTVPLLLWAPGLVRELPAAPLDATIAVAYLGVFPAAIAYLAWSYALKRMPATVLSTTLNLSPLIAILLAWLLIAEVPGPLSLIGGAIAIVGVLVMTLRGHREPVTEEEVEVPL